MVNLFVKTLLLSLILQISVGSAQTESEDPVTAKLSEVFKQAMLRQVRPNEPMQRPVFAKAHGCLKGQFILEKNLPPEVKVGVFAQKPRYNAIVRFSNDGPPRADQTASARGMAIKLLGVSGKKILPGEEDATTQDFVMQNYPRFFADDAQDFLDFILGQSKNPNSEKILKKIGAEVLRDPLDGKYWTPTPYRLGARAMKYMVKPCSLSPDANKKPMEEKNFLRANLRDHIQKTDGCFDFHVQLFKDDITTPLDKATKRWTSKTIPVAKLILPKGQVIDGSEAEKFCESLSFTGWHALPEHEPLGSINLARKIVYKQMADIRRQQNEYPLSEPKDE